jgi:hypothetical protein
MFKSRYKSPRGYPIYDSDLFLSSGYHDACIMQCLSPPLSSLNSLGANVLRYFPGAVLRKIFWPEEHLLFLRRSGGDELRNLLETVS